MLLFTNRLNGLVYVLQSAHDSFLKGVSSTSNSEDSNSHCVLLVVDSAKLESVDFCKAPPPL